MVNKDKRMVMYKEDGNKSYKYSVRFKLDGKNYFCPLYANLDRDEKVYYGGTILESEDTSNKGE